MSSATATGTAGSSPTRQSPAAHHHPHSHPHFPPLGANPVLDIGGNVGALLVHLPATTETGELHIRPTGNPAGQFHTGVHRRTTGGTSTWVALFREMEAGAYELLDDDWSPTAHVVVAGGRVAELDLR